MVLTKLGHGKTLKKSTVEAAEADAPACRVPMVSGTCQPAGHSLDTVKLSRGEQDTVRSFPAAENRRLTCLPFPARDILMNRSTPKANQTLDKRPD